MQNNTYKTCILLLLITFILNTSALAATQKSAERNKEVTISVPATIDILSIDGQAYQSPSLIEGNYILSLPLGTHSLVAQYYKNWDTIDESGNIIKWKPVKIVYTFNAKSHYSIEHTSVSDIDDAESLVNTPEIWLSSGNKKAVDGVLIEKQNTTFPLSSSLTENNDLKAQIQVLQQEVNTLKNNKRDRELTTIESFPFVDWETFKSRNPEQYKQFKAYQEYEDFLEYRRKYHTYKND